MNGRHKMRQCCHMDVISVVHTPLAFLAGNSLSQFYRNKHSGL
ncbi:hypothetical protein AGR1C_Cc11191 [Agrobacterium fabacearum TT111]|nr:hypothetical protein AGR1C_Cc11191 [Agrobacterium fabacearum TT111]